MTEKRGLLSISQASKLLGVSDATLRRWADEGAIQAVRLPSGYRRFEPAEVQRKRREMGFAEES